MIIKIVIGTLAMFTFLIGAFLGYEDGYKNGVKDYQQQAISNNVAYFEIVDKNTGDDEFKWNTQNLEKK